MVLVDSGCGCAAVPAVPASAVQVQLQSEQAETSTEGPSTRKAGSKLELLATTAEAEELLEGVVPVRVVVDVVAVVVAADVIVSLAGLVLVEADVTTSTTGSVTSSVMVDNWKGEVGKSRIGVKENKIDQEVKPVNFQVKLGSQLLAHCKA